MEPQLQSIVTYKYLKNQNLVILICLLASNLCQDWNTFPWAHKTYGMAKQIFVPKFCKSGHSTNLAFEYIHQIKLYIRSDEFTLSLFQNQPLNLESNQGVHQGVIFLNQKLFLEQIAYEFYKNSILEKKKSRKMNYYFLSPICKNGKNFKISYDVFDENGRCVLNETAKKTQQLFCCDRTTFINFDIAFSKETIA